MSDFVKVKGRKAVYGIQDPKSTKKEDVEVLKKALISKEEAIKASSLFKKIQSDLKSYTITKIRCLALGSPSQEEPALYQLAMLRLLSDAINVAGCNVSLFDPVFSPLDLELFREFHYQEEAIYESEPQNTLYFLPHAPLSLTDRIFRQDSPILLLGNNIITHTDRLTRSEVYEKYPVLAKLINIVGDNERTVDDFMPVVSKKKLRRNKKKFQEPELDYSKIETHFDKVQIIAYKDLEEGIWGNAFTDIALHSLTLHNDEINPTEADLF